VSERPAWHTNEFPELRSGPPWVTEEMVAAQPGLARQMLESPPDGLSDVAAAIRGGEAVTVVGCGTSEHGALAIAALVSEALGGGWPPKVVARQSLDAAERPQRGGVCIGISHDGGTRATTLALEAAAAGGAITVLVTNRPGGSASEPAQRVIVTPVHDDSWCHTVAYTSSIWAARGSTPIARSRSSRSLWSARRPRLRSPAPSASCAPASVSTSSPPASWR
jgi:fructoselysine-6-P-deglycase FrlB-like protein